MAPAAKRRHVSHCVLALSTRSTSFLQSALRLWLQSLQLHGGRRRTPHTPPPPLHQLPPRFPTSKHQISVCTMFLISNNAVNCFPSNKTLYYLIKFYAGTHLRPAQVIFQKLPVTRKVAVPIVTWVLQVLKIFPSTSLCASLIAVATHFPYWRPRTQFCMAFMCSSIPFGAARETGFVCHGANGMSSNLLYSVAAMKCLLLKYFFHLGDSFSAENEKERVNMFNLVFNEFWAIWSKKPHISRDGFYSSHSKTKQNQADLFCPRLIYYKINRLTKGAAYWVTFGLHIKEKASKSTVHFISPDPKLKQASKICLFCKNWASLMGSSWQCSLHSCNNILKWLELLSGS